MTTLNLTINAVRGCKHCSAASNFALYRGIAHTVKYFDTHETRTLVKEKYNHSTWPIIVNKLENGQEVLIGGFTDLIKEWQTMNRNN